MSYNPRLTPTTQPNIPLGARLIPASSPKAAG